MLYQLDLTNMITCGMAGRFYRHGRTTNGRQMRKIGRNLLVFVISGSARGEVADRTYRLSQGSVWMVPSGTPYCLSTEQGCEFFFFRFRGEMSVCDQQPCYSYSRNDNPLICQHLETKKICLSEHTILGEKYDEFMRRLERCLALGLELTHASQMLFCMELQRILIMLSAIGEEMDRSAFPPVLLKMTEYIRKNITLKITVSDLACQFKLSSSYITRLFRLYYNCSPGEYIRRSKMYYARILLKYDTLNVTEVADYLGYENVFYFSRVYKQFFHQSPTKDQSDD